MLGAFRLHRGVGPVIINMSRISVDLFFMSWIYVFLTLAWTFGLVHIRNNKSWIKELNANNTTQGINKCDFNRTCSFYIIFAFFKENVLLMCLEMKLMIALTQTSLFKQFMTWSGKFWILERETICGLPNTLTNLALPELSCTFAIKVLFSLFSSICWLPYLMQPFKGEFSSKKYQKMYQKCFDCEPYKTQNLLNKKQHLLKSVNTNFTLAVHSPKLNHAKIQSFS